MLGFAQQSVAGAMPEETIRILPGESRGGGDQRTAIDTTTKTASSRTMRRRAYWGLLALSILVWVGVIWLIVAQFH
jgi:hypothetical protein